MIEDTFFLLDKAKFCVDAAKDNLVDETQYIFKSIPVDCRVPLFRPCDVETWNKGYKFTVEGLYKRSDGEIMMYGTYCGKQETEFLSYLSGVDSIQTIANAIKKQFFSNF